MKKLLLIVCLAFVSTGAFAQQGFGIKAGFSMTNFLGDDNARMKPGFKFGLAYDYALNDILYLQPSLSIAGKGAQYSQQRPESTANASVNSLYVELPVLFSAKFSLSPLKSRFISVGLGPYAAVGVGGSTTFSGGFGGLSGRNGEPTFGDFIGMRRFDAGAVVGAGLELGNFLIWLDVQMGLTKLGANEAVIAPKARNLGATFSVGFRF